MNNRRKCKNFAWRDEDPAWIAERKNTRIVYQKIRRETTRGQSADRVIAALFANDRWAWRMTSQSPISWKVDYYRWIRTVRRPKIGSTVQAKKSSFDH